MSAADSVFAPQSLAPRFAQQSLAPRFAQQQSLAPRLAQQLWPRLVRVMDRVPETEWSAVAAVLRPFLTEPSSASYLAAHRLLGVLLRQQALRQATSARWQAELDAVRGALAHDTRFALLDAGAAVDARAGARLAALAMVVSLRELAEAKGEAAAQRITRRLRER